jgi:hypothetical protein
MIVISKYPSVNTPFLDTFCISQKKSAESDKRLILSFSNVCFYKIPKNPGKNLNNHNFSHKNHPEWFFSFSSSIFMCPHEIFQLISIATIRFPSNRGWIPFKHPEFGTIPKYPRTISSIHRRFHLIACFIVRNFPSIANPIWICSSELSISTTSVKHTYSRRHTMEMNRNEWTYTHPLPRISLLWLIMALSFLPIYSIRFFCALYLLSRLSTSISQALPNNGA